MAITENPTFENVANCISYMKYFLFMVALKDPSYI